MHRMSGLDATFLYDERPDESQHTLKVCILDAAASAHYTLRGTRDWVASRLPALPPLRWRAVRVPFDLHHPIWVEAAEVDLAHHVRSLAVPTPGGRDELCAAISQIASAPLDPRRPLWELWLLEGYEGDRVVAVLKLSHAIGDGNASRRLLEGLFSDAPLPRARPDASGSASGWTLARDAVRDALCDLARSVPRLARAAWRVQRRARRARAAGGLPARPPSVLAGPRTPFCGRPGPRRAFHFASVSLAEAKEVRRALGCTLNDVVIATAAGAVRAYLRERGALPGLPTLGWMIASTRDDATRASWGNFFTRRSLPLPTDVEHPVARVRAAARASAAAKSDLALRRGADLEDWLRGLPPFAAKGLSGFARTAVRLRPDLPGGVVVSNVPGPPERLCAPGGEVEQLVSVGHVKYVAALNITVWSYAGQLNFGLYGCADALPDLSRVAARLGEAFEELRKAAAREDARVALREG